MNNVIQFPGKDQRQWTGVADSITQFLKHLGATDQELPALLDKLHHRWEQLGKPFDLALPHSFPAPLTPEQLEAIDVALRMQVGAITEHFKEENAQTLLEFAKLEFKIFRLS
jgi:hypothetical protein